MLAALGAGRPVEEDVGQLCKASSAEKCSGVLCSWNGASCVVGTSSNMQIEIEQKLNHVSN